MRFPKRTSRRSRLERNKRQFARKKVDYYKYVKDFYLEDGLAYISCNVKDYYDIIDSRSVEGYEWLDESFAWFIESNAFYIPIEYPIVLEICGKKFTEQQQDTIIETIGDYYELKLGDKQMDLNNNTYRILAVVLFSIIAIIIAMFIRGIRGESIISEISLIMVWFFVWALPDLALFERRDLQEEKTYAAQLASIIVKFKEEFVDEPVNEEEKEEIYEILEQKEHES
ncbi:MAG: hypothetical protein K6D92_07875 [Erysipelotrichaceae bacterium]|jgi:hypothetical protein|nr:hypothetical protein [Erysipelotrichaceae bacterium]